MIITIFEILGIFTFGFFLADILLGRKSHILERISVGFLLGSAIFTFVLFLANWKLNILFGLRESLTILFILNLFSFLSNIFVSRLSGLKNIFDYNLNFKQGFENLSVLEKIIIGLILFLFLSSLIHNLYWPVSDWDSLALYDFRAKVFLSERSVVDASLNNDYFVHYPMYTSLLHLFIYQFGLVNPMFIYSILYLSFVLIFYFLLLNYSVRLKSLLFTLILAFTPEFFGHSMMAYTNLPYSIFLSLGVFYLYRWINDSKFSILVLSSLLVGFSSWVRITELFWVVPVFFVSILSLKKRKLIDFLVFTFIVYSIYFLYKVFMNFIFSSLSLGNTFGILPFNLVSYLSRFDFERWWEVSTYLYKYVFSTWGVLFLAFIFSVVFSLFERRKKLFLFLILLFFAFLFVATYVFSFANSTWREIPDSARRMSMFFIPLIIFHLAIFDFDMGKSFKSSG